MFVAKRKNGEFVTLLYGKKEDVMELKKVERFYCPACNSEVIPKLGEIVRYHFAHVRKECSTSSESESLYHLEGKRKLYELLQNTGEVSIEHYIKETNQRVDLLFKKEEKTFAIEFQCSNLSIADLQKRTLLYESQNLIPVWILSKKRFRSLYTLSSINTTNWLFLQKNNYLKFPYIICFCPVETVFYYLFPFYPFSSQKTFITIYKSKQLIVDNFSNTPSLPDWKTKWLQYKRNWRYEYCLYRNLIHLKNFCYGKYGVPLSEIPAVIGIPVREQYVIETPLIEWQTYIYFSCIHRTPVGSTVSFTSIYNHFLKLIHFKKVKLRSLPLIKEMNISNPIKSYLNTLCGLGILEEVSTGIYEKKENPITPRTIDQAIKEDKMVLSRITLSF
ncbi:MULTISPECIES: competence protein CoiA [Bacillus]|uniref:competence protein CoiA n=1 Tax=Bacillus TaxID=1386 RepID=UPI000BB6D958|nr:MULTISPECIES: competence protein CoiA family protein [Bacillus]